MEAQEGHYEDEGLGLRVRTQRFRVLGFSPLEFSAILGLSYRSSLAEAP